VTEETSRDRSTHSGNSSVLIVEDESDLADMYAAYLADSFDVSVVYGGQEALDVLDDTVDVVLLDRRMPVVSGNEVLAHMEDRGLDPRVALVTAVDPDFEIIDLQIDDYLVKPVAKDEMRETVERLLALSEYDQQMRKLTSKKLKRNVLEIEKTRPELAESEEFARLNEEIAALETEVDAIERELDVGNVDR
jgi:two-component system response regulator AdeR